VSELQCVAVCCSVLQCGVLQFECSVLQCECCVGASTSERAQREKEGNNGGVGSGIVCTGNRP